MDAAYLTDRNILTVLLSGRFTFNDHSVFKEVIRKIEDERFQTIILQMEKLTFIDSAALGLLLLAHEAADRYKKPIKLSGVNGQVQQVLQKAHLDSIFDII